VNSELVEEFNSNLQGLTYRNYRSLDSIKVEECRLIAIDTDFFESVDMVQFYLSKIRKKLPGIPVVLLMRVGFIESIDFEWFFDEFVLYPFRKGELSIRIVKVLGRRDLNIDDNVLSIGNLTINLSEYSVYLNNEKIVFTYKEFELLRLLVQNKGTVFTRKDLLAKIWGVEYIGGTRTVDVHIKRLRGKLGDEFNSIIETVRNVGYRCRDNAE
jgi:DNA-binding response OmpR family regulator